MIWINQNQKHKIPDTSGLVKKTDCNPKIAEIEGKIPDVSNLATKTALTSVENKLPSVSSVVKKTDYNIKIAEIENKLNNHDHDKYITTPEFNNLVADVFNIRLARANSVTKADFDNAIPSFDSKFTTNKTISVSIENLLKKLQKLDLSYFHGKAILKKMAHKIIQHSNQ